MLRFKAHRPPLGRPLCAISIVVACAAAGMLVSAQAFMFQIANPVAAQDFRFKSAAFVFRTVGCAEPAKPEITGRAEGLVNGSRQSLALKIVPAAAKPGVYAVIQNWPAEGRWVVNLNGSCAGMTAGAVIPVGPKGIVRESSKLLPHAASDAEVEAALKSAPEQGESK